MLPAFKGLKRNYNSFAVSLYNRFGGLGSLSFVLISGVGSMALFLAVWALMSLIMDTRDAELVALLALVLPISIGLRTFYEMFFITVEEMWFYCGIYRLSGVQGRPISTAVMARVEDI